MENYEEVLKILHDQFDWKLTDSLTTTGKKLVADTIKALKIAEKDQTLQLHKTNVSGSAWIKVLSDHEITEYSKNLDPIWIILEEDETQTPILAQPDGDDDFHGEDGIIYHYCDISHFMKIDRPVF